MCGCIVEQEQDLPASSECRVWNASAAPYGLFGTYVEIIRKVQHPALPVHLAFCLANRGGLLPPSQGLFDRLPEAVFRQPRLLERFVVEAA
jgi:hypothetical protein